MRCVYNETLMNRTSYSDPQCIKGLLSNYYGLARMAKAGDGVAMALLIDLRTVLGVYHKEDCRLSGRQLQAIVLNLIYGYSQKETGKIMGIVQHTVHVHVTKGIEIIRIQLCGEGL